MRIKGQILNKVKLNTWSGNRKGWEISERGGINKSLIEVEERRGNSIKRHEKGGIKLKAKER